MRPMLDTPPGPQLSSPQPTGPAIEVATSPAAARLVLVFERNRESDMGDHRVAKSVVLDGILEDALEPGARPAAGEVECFTDHTELGLHGVPGEVGQLDVVGDVLGHRRIVRRVAVAEEVRAVLGVVAEP